MTDDLPLPIRLHLDIPREGGFIISELLEDGEHQLLGCSSAAELAGWVQERLHHFDRRAPAKKIRDGKIIDGPWPRILQTLRIARG